MFAAIRRYVIDPDQMDAVVARVAGVAEVYKTVPGHIAYYLVREPSGTLTSVGLFVDREAAEAARLVASKWITENAADLLGAPVLMTRGEVVVQS
ncbi:MAG: antibiotic biosynthesis monooxygenase [Proteobacteria bacterium]|nr:antibiotic biosynthesis monooxygenase [Pseudomonadota bacterium]